VRYLLDTHSWIWGQATPERLGANTRAILEGTGDYEELLLSAMSIVELGILVAKNRVEVQLPLPEWVAKACSMTRFRLVHLSGEIGVEAATLPGDFHFDPADRVIAATARIEGATILTADRALHAYPHVRCLW
jgi:PIN domain nuclease of toxin-antitoxin system